MTRRWWVRHEFKEGLIEGDSEFDKDQVKCCQHQPI